MPMSKGFFVYRYNLFSRIVWASPETARNWYGTAAGSIEAGYKGAIRALQEAKPNTLTLEDLSIIR